MSTFDTLFSAAKELHSKRPHRGENNFVSAAITDTGRILTSVWVDAKVDSACLCCETGCICEAHKLGEKIVAILSLDPNGKVIASCGVCQERLAYFGMETQIAIPSENSFIFKKIAELRPHYWAEKD